MTAGLLLLTASTGVVDAVSYLALDRVFTGNMTGNVLFLGLALLGAAEIPFLNNAVALAGFVIGVILSARIVGVGGAKGRLPRASVWVLAASGLLALALATSWLLIGALGEPVQLLITFLLAAIMGAQVAAVKPIGHSDVTTIVVTSTIVNLARDSRLAGGTGRNWLTRLLAITAMAAGAAIGAALIAVWSGYAALYGAAVVFALGAGVLIRASTRS